MRIPFRFANYSKPLWQTTLCKSLFTGIAGLKRLNIVVKKQQPTLPRTLSWITLFTLGKSDSALDLVLKLIFLLTELHCCNSPWPLAKHKRSWFVFSLYFPQLPSQSIRLISICFQLYLLSRSSEVEVSLPFARRFSDILWWNSSSYRFSSCCLPGMAAKDIDLANGHEKMSTQS